MKEICLTVLVGLPGVGKTTLCKRFLEFSNINVIHICYDNFIKFIPGNVYKHQRNEMTGKIREIVESVLREKPLPQFVYTSCRTVNSCRQFIILIDDNNYYRGMRYDFYRLAKDFKISFAQIYFSIPLEIALKQNYNRLNQVPEDIMHRIGKRIQVPSTKNKWEYNTLIINNIDVNYMEVLQFLINSFHLPIKKIQKPENDFVEQSTIHKIDIQLRKRITTVMKGFCSEKANLSSMAAYLNNKRKEILDDLRNNKIILDDGADYSHVLDLL